MKNKFYVTTPIYYVNDVPHVGSAYTTIAADVLARYHRMIGDKTFFLTGTDEHGAKIEAKAEEAGIEPQQFVDEISAKYQLVWDELNISNDKFIRTTDKEHEKAVQKALEYLYKKGDIYKGRYEGLYCRGCEQFKNEKDLVDGKCPDHNKAPEKTSEECYMFKMSKYADQLIEKIRNDEFKIMPTERKNEILSFYKNGLQDISFSRKNVKWGIPLPWDKNHTAYVWIDAFLNYLTGLCWQGPEYKIPEMWPPDVQLMSKDILRVHATIWPAMLLALDLPLPKQLFIHGFFLVDGQKMSKSLGNVIAPGDMVKRYGVDAARYLLMSATTFGHDGDIGWQWFDEKYNADLAKGLGNLVARSVALILNLEKQHLKLIKNNEDGWFGIEDDWRYISERMNSLEIHRVLNLINENISLTDRYLSHFKPWKMMKDKDGLTGDILYNVLERIRHIALMIYPFMPETAEKIYNILGLGLIEKEVFDKAIKWGGLGTEIKIKKGEALFPRI